MNTEKKGTYFRRLRFETGPAGRLPKSGPLLLDLLGILIILHSHTLHPLIRIQLVKY